VRWRVLARYVNVATGCVPQGCSELSAAGAFADPYLQPSTAGGCEFDLDHGDSCALTCVQGRIAASGAAMTTTCQAGVLVDPGTSCVSPGIAITPSELDILEGGSGVFFIQALTPVYTNPVTVHLSTTSTGTVTFTNSAGAEVSTVQFTSANWNVFQTITVTATENARVAASPVAAVISFAVASLNSAYSSLTLPSVTINVEDDDVAGIVVDTTGTLSVAEADSALSACDRSNGATTTIEYVLLSQPTGTVQLGFTVDGSNPALGVICESSRLIFTTANWATPQSLVVAAVGTDVHEAAGQSFTITGVATSTDPMYSSASSSTGLVAPVTVEYLDNDVSGVALSSLGVRQVQEGGDPVVFEVALDSRPTGTVTFTASLDDTTFCALVDAGPDGTVVVDVADALWETGVAFSVASVDDDTLDGTVDCTLTVSTASEDPNYDGLSASGVIERFETDVAGLTLALPPSGCVLLRCARHVHASAHHAPYAKSAGAPQWFPHSLTRKNAKKHNKAYAAIRVRRCANKKRGFSC
jgi:hypothetical protein